MLCPAVYARCLSGRNLCPMLPLTHRQSAREQEVVSPKTVKGDSDWKEDRMSDAANAPLYHYPPSGRGNYTNQRQQTTPRATDQSSKERNTEELRGKLLSRC
jgi:hypothetical protein